MDLITVQDLNSSHDAAEIPLSKGRSREYSEKLEEGNILFFPETPFRLSDAEIEFLLSQRQLGKSYHKNIAYRPCQDRLSGFVSQGGNGDRLRTIMRSYSERAVGFLSELFPHYAETWRVDFTSFRPIEEWGRDLRPRARNDLLHIDAFPTRPTNGDRILRVFTNINPSEPRVWVTSDGFETLARRYARAAGLPVSPKKSRSASAWAHRAFAAVARSMGFRWTERSPYDRGMLHFHHFLKHNVEFQENCTKRRWEFPPNSTWMVFTDMVSHAVLSGQYALEQTVIVSQKSLVLPDRAPRKILENLFGLPHL